MKPNDDQHLQDILDDVRDEHRRSVEIHGEQDLPLCDEIGAEWRRSACEWTRYRCESEARAGRTTWEDVLRVEVAEAYAAADIYEARAEMVQAANVAIKAIENLDKRIDDENPWDVGMYTGGIEAAKHVIIGAGGRFAEYWPANTWIGRRAGWRLHGEEWLGYCRIYRGGSTEADAALWCAGLSLNEIDALTREEG
jgi:hypothetical protein